MGPGITTVSTDLAPCFSEAPPSMPTDGELSLGRALLEAGQQVPKHKRPAKQAVRERRGNFIENVPSGQRQPQLGSPTQLFVKGEINRGCKTAMLFR
jgi:hypothetical protein